PSSPRFDSCLDPVRHEHRAQCDRKREQRQSDQERDTVTHGPTLRQRTAGAQSPTRRGRIPSRRRARGAIFTSMRRIAALALLATALAAAGRATAATPRVLAIHFTAEVNPVTQGYINHEIGQAEKKGYSAVVIVMDTPGGLSDSMRKIYLRELSAKIP